MIPSIFTLGDGTYTGIISGYTFTYNNKKYHTVDKGIRGINVPITITVKDSEIIFKHV